jgi:hypothetical protein
MPTRAQRQQRRQLAGLDLGNISEVAAGLRDATHALKLELHILDLILERDQWRIGSGHRSAVVSSAADHSADAGNFAYAERRRRDEDHEKEDWSPLACEGVQCNTD